MSRSIVVVITNTTIPKQQTGPIRPRVRSGLAHAGEDAVGGQQHPPPAVSMDSSTSGDAMAAAAAAEEDPAAAAAMEAATGRMGEKLSRLGGLLGAGGGGGGCGVGLAALGGGAGGGGGGGGAMAVVAVNNVPEPGSAEAAEGTKADLMGCLRPWLWWLGLCVDSPV